MSCTTRSPGDFWLEGFGLIRSISNICIIAADGEHGDAEATLATRLTIGGIWLVASADADAVGRGIVGNVESRRAQPRQTDIFPGACGCSKPGRAGRVHAV